jgi:phosphoribosyl 1,2-cyclic phosphodiesterase
MRIYVKFWGTRGSIPTPGDRTRKYGGNTACVELRCGSHLFICDAGSGIRELGADLLARGTGPIVGHFFFSHTHWDHIQGFPFFDPADRPGNRFLIYGVRQGDDRLYHLLSGQMKSDYFPIGFGALRAEILADHLDDGRKEIEEVLVESFPLNHPGGCLGYAFSHRSKKIVYATDNEVELEPGQPESDGEVKLRIARPALVEFVRNADLLIADGQYSDTEYMSKRGWGHTSCLTAVDLAVQAGAKHLAIFHHDPTHADSFVDEVIESCRHRVNSFGSELIVFAAREGMELEV